jgi:hypothetical protein
MAMKQFTRKMADALFVIEVDDNEVAIEIRHPAIGRRSIWFPRAVLGEFKEFLQEVDPDTRPCPSCACRAEPLENCPAYNNTWMCGGAGDG